MDRLLELDRRVVLFFALPLRKLQDRITAPVHPIVFWTAAALHLVVWAVLSLAQDQPEWLWYLVGFTAGVVGAYVTDNEPVAPLAPGVALTQSGVDARWALMRLIYLVTAAVGLLPRFLVGGFAPLVAALLVLEVALFVLMEYLLAFRLVDEREMLAKMISALGIAPPA